MSPNNTVHVTCSEFSISYVVFKKEINKMFQINKKKATLAQSKLDKEKSLNFKHGCKKRVDLRYAHYIIENKVSISNTAKYFGVFYPTVYRNLRSIKKYYPELYIKAVEILKI